MYLGCWMSISVEVISHVGRAAASSVCGELGSDSLSDVSDEDWSRLPILDKKRTIVTRLYNMLIEIQDGTFMCFEIRNDTAYPQLRTFDLRLSSVNVNPWYGRSVTCRIANLFFERIRRISGMVSRQSLVEAHLESLCVTFSYVLCKTTACYISNFFDRPLSNIQLSPKNNSVVLHSSVIPFEIISSSTN